MLDVILGRLDHHDAQAIANTERLIKFILEMEQRIMAGNDQIIAALNDLKADLTSTLTDLESAVQTASTSGDPQPALDLISSMKSQVDTAHSTVTTVASAPGPTPAAPPADGSTTS